MMRGQNLFYSFMILVITTIGAWLLYLCGVPNKDNAVAYIGVLTFMTTNMGFFAAKITADQNQQILVDQNSVLAEMHEKVNGGTERALAALREQHRIQIHDMNNELNNMKMKLELSERECVKAKEELAALKGKNS